MITDKVRQMKWNLLANYEFYHDRYKGTVELKSVGGGIYDKTLSFMVGNDIFLSNLRQDLLPYGF